MGVSASLEYAFVYIFDHYYFENFMKYFDFFGIRIYKLFLFICLPPKVAQEFGRHFFADLTPLTISTESHWIFK